MCTVYSIKLGFSGGFIQYGAVLRYYFCYCCFFFNKEQKNSYIHIKKKVQAVLKPARPPRQAPTDMLQLTEQCSATVVVCLKS